MSLLFCEILELVFATAGSINNGSELTGMRLMADWRKFELAATPLLW